MSLGALRLRLIGASATLVCLTALWLVAPVAIGAAPQTSLSASGWWWRAQTGVGPSVPSPPNVGEDDLMVGATAGGASAIAAVAFVLADNRINPSLTLALKPDGDQGGENAVLLACHAGSAWESTAAGVWDSKPQADCSTSVTGIRSEGGTSWTFALGPLQFDDEINVVIVPGVAPDGTIGTYNLVFDGPTASNVETLAGSAPTPSVTTTETPASSVPAATTPAAVGTPGGEAPPAPSDARPAVPAAPAIDEADQGISATAPRLVAPRESTPVPAPAPTATSRTAARIGGLLAATIGLGSGYLALTGQLPTGIVAATPETPVAGGLGRFRRDRISEPPAVS
jgi:hypothetical protein